jgi:hypothetical protein
VPPEQCTPQCTQATWKLEADEEASNAVVEELANISVGNPVDVDRVGLERVEDDGGLAMPVWRRRRGILEDAWSG